MVIHMRILELKDGRQYPVKSINQASYIAAAGTHYIKKHWNNNEWCTEGFRLLNPYQQLVDALRSR